MSEAIADILADPPDEPIVHWMERPPGKYGPAAIGGALFGAFALGVLTTLAAVALGRAMAHDGP